MELNYNLKANKATVESILEHIQKSSIFQELQQQANQESDKEPLLLLKEINDWIKEAKLKPIPKMLFGEFWFESEFCFLFSDTNLGKTILAYQIGDSICKGKEIPGFKLTTEIQPVLYCDFELSGKQLENRYSVNYSDHYTFPQGFFRIEINPDAHIPDTISFEDFVTLSLQKKIEETGARILIIDNITYLKNETEKAKNALPLVKHLKLLKSKYNLSILVLAHTPKRDLSKPITQNDQAGSKNLMNFCDSCFAIGESGIDKNLRYLKQIKQRNTEQIYGAENICLCQIVKPTNFVQFEFINFGLEIDHLKQKTHKDAETLDKNIIALREQGLSYRLIASELGISHMKALRTCEKHNKI